MEQLSADWLVCVCVCSCVRVFELESVHDGVHVLKSVCACVNICINWSLGSVF